MATEQIPTDLIADDAVSTDKIANDASISTSGNIVTTGSGTLTVAGNTTLSGTNNLGSNPTITLGSNATFPVGHILQVKHFIFTGTQDSTTSFAPIQFDGTSSSTGYGCDITLSSASNKVLIFGTISLGYQDGGYNTQATAEYSTNGGSSYSNLDVMHTDYWAFWEHAQGDLGQGYNLYTRSFSELKATGSTTNHFRMQIRKNTSNGNSTVNKAYLTNNYTDNTTIQLLEVVA